MRRWTTTRRRLWLALVLAGSAAIAELFEIGPWVAVPIVVFAFRLGIPLDSRSWIRPALTALVVALVIMAGIRVLIGIPYVAISVPSPDGRVVAELVETDWLIDRHFKIRLTTRWLGVIPRRQTLFRPLTKVRGAASGYFGRETGGTFCWLARISLRLPKRAWLQATSSIYWRTPPWALCA